MANASTKIIVGPLKSWIIRLVLSALLLLLVFSLGSYDSTDPSLWRRSINDGVVQNLCGRLGSELASLLYKSFGFISWIFPFYLGWEISLKEEQESRRRWSWLVLVLTLATILSGLPDRVLSGDIIRWGGGIGHFIFKSNVQWMGSVGLYIVLTTLISIAVLVISPSLSAWVMNSIVQGWTKYLWPILKPLPLDTAKRFFSWITMKLDAWKKSRTLQRQQRLAQNQKTFEEQRAAQEHVQRENELKKREIVEQDPKTTLPEIKSINLDHPVLEEFKSKLLRAVEDPIPPALLETPQMSVDAQGRDLIQPPLPIEDTKLERRPTKPKKNKMTLPPRDFFDLPVAQEKFDRSILKTTEEAILQKLLEFKISGQVVGNRPGPIVTVYEFQPDPGIPLSKILNMEEDLAMALQAEAIRMDRISGKNAVGIEVPNPTRELIVFREILDSPSFKNSTSLLTMALGKDISGHPLTMDLAKMPHLLIGGSTGSGKSVAVNAMICSILVRATSDEVKMILIDPKMVEMGVYENIPHLWSPVVTDMKEAGRVLKWVVAQMEDRYKRLAALSVRNLEQYNEKIKKHGGSIDLPEAPANTRWTDRPETLEELPYVIVVIDELADLIMVARAEVEESITRISQKSRAVGIHLILATQRPSVDILTGVIKSNLPSRISYRVSTKIDSRTILDCSGAENLLGQGDGLFLAPGAARPSRIHAPFLTEVETLRLVDWLRNQGAPDYNQHLIKVMETDEAEDAMGLGGDSGGASDIYQKAVEVVIREQKASTSLLQRKLGLGYGRAARIIDRMENEGIIGPDRGAGKPREIFGRSNP